MNDKKKVTLEDVKRAAYIIREYCTNRDERPETYCRDCPIKEICLNEPWLWELDEIK